MRRNYFFSRNRDALLEPCDGKLSRTVLRGESPRKGADLLDAHILLVDTGNSYQGLCRMIHDRTNGKDGIYITYEEDNPISFNPFYTESGKFDVEKRDSINTLILTLWKREDESPKRSEEVALSGAVNAYIRKISENRNIRPDFNGFYEFVADDYRRMIEEKKVREKDFDIDGFLNVLEPFYRGGDYDFLLNSDKELDLTGKRFIVFELDNISSNKVLLPVVTLIIMETFIAKMRRLKGIRKMILIEECWKALMSANMSEYIKYLFKTVRKYFGEAVVVTQEEDDIIVLPHVKDDTDTEYAAKLASEKGFDEALLLGALGGRRLEHTLANLCTGLGLEQRGVRATLLDERSRITFVMPGETRRYPKDGYFYLSVFPMEGRAEGVSERGSFYELTDAVLTAGYPLGVSNEYADGSDCITISTQKGALVVVETVPDGPILS